MLLESEIERNLVRRLNEYGFKVFKLHTPGHTGVMDRMILRPRYSPGPPMFVEIKRGGKNLRAKQAAIGEDWKMRGCVVLNPVKTPGECDQLCTYLIDLIMPDYAFARI